VQRLRRAATHAVSWPRTNLSPMAQVLWRRRSWMPYEPN